ncbi:MAG: TIGR04282 family arsenosugar biosynthesis glycosyltransferase [Betaproteobacteria bacterium]
MPITETSCCLVIYAKAPIPGQVKTRLAQVLDSANAALLHTALVERALDTARRSGMSRVELCCAPDVDHSFFQACADDFDVTLTGQGEGDLGERMLRTLVRTVKPDGAAIIIGADCPALTGTHIAAAARALADHDVVLTPAEDGGYVLVGARRTHAGMFDAIDWGSAAVLAQQRQNLGRLGLSWHEMPTLWDIDRPEDLPRLKALKPPLEFYWPA